MAWPASYVILRGECEGSSGCCRWRSLDLHVRTGSNSEQTVLSEELRFHCHSQGDFGHNGTVLGPEHVIFGFVTVRFAHVVSVLCNRTLLYNYVPICVGEAR